MFCHRFNIPLKKSKPFKKIISNASANFSKHLFFLTHKETIEAFANSKKEFNGTQQYPNFKSH